MNDVQPKPSPSPIAPVTQSSGGDSRCLKVLLVNRALSYHVPGGLERYVEDLALGLEGAGCQVHILSAPMPPQAAAALQAAGLVLHPCPEASPRRYSLRYLAFVGRRICALQRQHHFDLIHGQEFALGFYRPGPDGPPVILTVHGTITSETPLHPDVYSLLGPIAKCLAWLRFGRRLLFAPAWRRSLAASRRILVDSEFTRRELGRIHPAGASRVRMVPLAVRETGPEAPAKAQARADLGWQCIHFLTVGRLEWQKGHDLALKALAGLKHYEWRYTIIGSGPRREALERLVRQLGLDGRVELVGRVSQEAKQKMLAAADLFLWPERTHPAFGLVGLEAMVSRTPALATERGAIPEVLGGTPGAPDVNASMRQVAGGWLVREPSAQAFKDALDALLAHPETLAGFDGEALRHSALERFSFERHIQATLGIYREVVTHPKPGG